MRKKNFTHRKRRTKKSGGSERSLSRISKKNSPTFQRKNNKTKSPFTVKFRKKKKQLAIFKGKSRRRTNLIQVRFPAALMSFILASFKNSELEAKLKTVIHFEEDNRKLARLVRAQALKIKEVEDELRELLRDRENDRLSLQKKFQDFAKNLAK